MIESNPVYYRKGDYKYQLTRDWIFQTRLRPDHDIETEFINLTTSGLMTLKTAYACDGVSGPAINTKTNRRAAFYHDGGYQLIRGGYLPYECREILDLEFRDICIKDGMRRWRAWGHYQGVRLGGGPAASTKARKKELTAP